MIGVVKLLSLLEAGNAFRLLVKGEHSEGELRKVCIHEKRTAFCPDTGTPCEKRDVLDLRR